MYWIMNFNFFSRKLCEKMKEIERQKKEGVLLLLLLLLAGWLTSKTVWMCFHSSERHRRHICSPLFRSQYTIHTGKRMKITTSRDRRFRNEFFMLARLSRDTDTSIHAHTHTYSYKHERVHTSTLNCSNEYAFFRRFASKTFGRILSPK